MSLPSFGLFPPMAVPDIDCAILLYDLKFNLNNGVRKSDINMNQSLNGLETSALILTHKWSQTQNMLSNRVRA